MTMAQEYPQRVAPRTKSSVSNVEVSDRDPHQALTQPSGLSLHKSSSFKTNGAGRCSLHRLVMCVHGWIPIKSLMRLAEARHWLGILSTAPLAIPDAHLCVSRKEV